jgi:hypothetical protein
MFMSLSVIRCSSNPLHLQKLCKEKSAQERKEKKKKKKEERMCVKFKSFVILLQVDWQLDIKFSKVSTSLILGTNVRFL